MDAELLETKSDSHAGAEASMSASSTAFLATMAVSAESSRQGSASAEAPAWNEQSETQQQQQTGSILNDGSGDDIAQRHSHDAEVHASLESASATREHQDGSPAQRLLDVSPSSNAASAALNSVCDLTNHSAQQSSPYAVGNHTSNGNHGTATSSVEDDSAYQFPNAPPSTSASPSKGGATVLMASRKQNSACDACRSRKVRCNRDHGEAKCNHCKAKNIDCTTLYVQWATSSSKRPTKRARSSMHAPVDEKREGVKPPEILDAAVQAQDRLLNALFQRDTEYAPADNRVYLYQNLPCNAPLSATGYTTRNVLPAAYLPGPKPAAATSAELHLLDRQRREDFVNDLVETYFSVVHARLPLLNPQTFRKRYYERSEELGGPPSDIILAIVIAWGAKFSENPLIAQDRQESAVELQKAHFQAQAALLKGETEKANQITGVKGGIEQPILTVPEELREQGRNRIADHLTWRAQDVMDRLRVARVATLENAQACFLMESLLLHPSVYFNGNPNISGTPVPAKHRSLLAYTNGHWYVIAIKHMLDLGINCKEKVMTIKDAALRGETLFAWWLACMADAASSLYFQRRCLISVEDYNSDPPAGDADDRWEAPHPLGSQDSYLAFFGSAHDAVTFQRKLSSMYFAPRSHIEGVRFDKVVDITEMLKKWRVDHLEKVGVPLPHWPPHWDYIAAVSACTSDINYHANWIVLWRLVDEMGIYCTDRSDATSPIHQDRLKRRTDSDAGLRGDIPDPERVQIVLATIQEEALNSALRIAGLTEILRSNQYLRLDPCNSLQSLEQAAHMLIRFQRSEVDIIVAGFRQYGLSYEDCFDKADLMEDLAAAYNERARTDPNFVPGSALGLALERDANNVAENEGIPGLAIAAAALSNAAASANADEEVGAAPYDFETQAAPIHPQATVGQDDVPGDVKDVNNAAAFDSMFTTEGDSIASHASPLNDDEGQK
ncbi:uncharacterized protein MEPE_00426 [Melanopsichium pennsylvanicum]|uniref:Zn(2)-C6 fungal-type domain-containing protein n=2 Tax=Melanopsichium pennsylvanicum TaxID=63383 RepID=A0AAJ5C2N3_9BASI|nr:uncharacterized protein BN887_00324 [Melanopsichium pennsylvanicum 4]SNX81721.1 uncharacterized protein MEPE_00426 [Melanopsichium pennsylvanicum]